MINSGDMLCIVEFPAISKYLRNDGMKSQLFPLWKQLLFYLHKKIFLDFFMQIAFR